MNKTVEIIVRVIVWLYGACVSPFLAPSCRFTPTCSVYMAEAVKRHGGIKGLSMGLRRLLACHPWDGSAASHYDPVPGVNAEPKRVKRQID